MTEGSFETRRSDVQSSSEMRMLLIAGRCQNGERAYGVGAIEFEPQTRATPQRVFGLPG
jgi:hypothetical protein